MEKELAPYGMYNVSDVRLEYVAADTVLLGGDVLEYRPAWCFTVEEQSRDTSHISPKRLLICDAQTGDICCWNDRKDDYDFGEPKPTGIADNPSALENEITVNSLKQRYGLSDEEFNKLMRSPHRPL